MPMQRLPDDVPARVHVHRHPGGAAVLAAFDLQAGDVVTLIVGPIVPQPARFTVQVGVAAHVTAPLTPAGEPDPTHAWPFLNHSCGANAVLRGRTLIALRPIAVGEEVTFDYDTTEWELAEPFACRCGAAACRGLIRGYRHLSPAQQRLLRPHLAPHLLDGGTSRRDG